MTLQLTGDSELGTFITGMCYKFRLGKLLSKKCTLTIAMKYQLGETRLSNATADLLVPDTTVIKTTAECWWGVMRPLGQFRASVSLPAKMWGVQCEQEPGAPL